MTASTGSPESSVQSPPTDIRLVLVEDYSLVRVALATHLNSIAGLSVVGEAATAEQGISQIKQLVPHVVLMDLGLPGMNGVEATRVVKQIQPNIKVIILTSHDDQESVIAALASGANAYCLKDIAAERLVEVIRTVMEGAAWLDQGVAQIALAMFSSESMRARPESRPPITPLGEREKEVLRLLAQGKNNTEIGNELYISVHTVKTHVSSILQKLAVSDRVQAAVKAIQDRIIEL